MSLLQQDSPGTVDDATRGESYTKGTSHVIIASVIATVLVSIAIAIYVIAGQKPPAATAEISDVWAHPMHMETSGFDANGATIPTETIDSVLVFAHVRLHNQSRQRIFLQHILANIMLADGMDSSYAATAVDYERVFKAYPALAPYHAPPISTETTLDPGQTVEGTFAASFRLPKDQWDARKSIDFTFGFQYLPNLKVPFQGTVTER